MEGKPRPTRPSPEARRGDPDPRRVRQLMLYVERLRILERELTVLRESPADASVQRLRARVRDERRLIRELCADAGLACPVGPEDPEE